VGAAGHSLPPDSAAGTVLICGRNTGALARRPPLGLASAARGTNGGASARSLLRCTSAAAPVPEPGAATAVSGRALGAAVAAACGAACSSCCSFSRTCGAKPLPPLLQPASVAGAGGVRASAARLGVAGDAASRAALVAASPVVAAGRLLQPSAAAAGAGGGAAPAARLIVAGDVASRAALVDAPPAGAAGLLQRPSAAAAGADSAALRRRAAGATAQMGEGVGLDVLGRGYGRQRRAADRCALDLGHVRRRVAGRRGRGCCIRRHGGGSRGKVSSDGRGAARRLHQTPQGVSAMS